MSSTPVLASNWKALPEFAKEAMLQMGAVPVNDIFFPVWERTDPVVLLYGSYGSGKSVFIVDKWIDKALKQKYFRGYFGRKVLDTVRGTVFKTITDRIKERHLTSRFSFSDAPNGSMHILCRENGNEMIPFGGNDPEGLKSIKDPTDFFCEELDQFTFEDFGFLFSRLRTTKAVTQFWGAFNTERVYKSHWIRRVMFDGEYAGIAFKLKANFSDNEFLDREDYEKRLRLIANGNAATYNSIALGEWGMVRTGEEFWKQFDETRHVKQIGPDIKRTIHVSLDSNVNPYVTQTVWQIDPEARQIMQVHELLCEAPENNAPKAARAFARWLRQIGYKDVVYVYGDPSANARSTVDENNRSFFDKYLGELTREGFVSVSRVQKSAPQVALSGAFVNEIYENNLGGWSIAISDRCFSSIEDYLLVKEDVDGTMKKYKETDKETQIRYEPHGHISDTKRYFLVAVLAAEFKAYRDRAHRRTGGGPVDVPR